jgi:hypothetical protein
VQILMLIRPAWLWYTKRGVTNVPQADWGTLNRTFALVLDARRLHRLPGGAGWRWRSCGRYWLAVQK